MFLLIASFLAGVLTSLAPCILPLLPVIVGSSLLSDGDHKKDRRKPYIIAGSLALSVVIFTLLLKVSSVLIGLNPSVLTAVSGGIVILIGITMFFPYFWVRVSSSTGFEKSSNQLLSKAFKHSGTGGAILTGAALGPVFSSCSPVYALLLATVLPVNLALGVTYIFSFALGLGLALLAIALIGRRLTTKLGWAVNPNGAFRKILAVILVVVGLLVITGNIQKFQVWSAEHLPFGVSTLEQKLVPSNPKIAASTGGGGAKEMFNTNPYDAPELQGIAGWINADPTTLKQLQGKVVLIDFWTYSCINCQRTQPYLNAWYDKYHNDGLEIIGVHAPEFAFEKVPENVKKAVKQENIKYPVALDNDFTTWRAYNNQYWPAKYLIDKDGQVRYTHFGEGSYAETEKIIQSLLKEAGKTVDNTIETDNGANVSVMGQTPETYLGYQRAERFANTDQFIADKPVDYTLFSNLQEHEWSLGGKWQMSGEFSQSSVDNARLSFNFSAREVYLVMSGPPGSLVSVSVEGLDQPGGSDVNAQGKVSIDGARLYKLVSTDTFLSNKRLTLTFPAGITVNAFTFGG